jgi:membrane protein
VRRRLDTAVGSSRFLALLHECWRLDRSVAGTLLSAALAFRIFIWLLPCALLVSAFLGFTPSGDGSVGSQAQQAGLSPLMASVLDQVAGQSRGGRYVTGAVALVLLAYAGAGLARAMDGVRVRVWGPFERRGIRSAAGRAAAYSGVLLLLLTCNAAIALLQATIGLSVVLASLLAVAAFVVVGDLLLASGPADWRAALPGAVVFAVGVEALRLVSTYYLPGRFERATELYGAIGLAAVTLVWLTLLARLLVMGHVLNRTLWLRSHPAADPGAS